MKKYQWGERENLIMRYLLTKTTKCATLEEIAKAIDNNKQQTLISLSRLKKRGIIKRSWVLLGKRKKRLYCLS